MKTLKVATLAAFSAMVTEDLLALGSQQKKEIHIALPGGRSAKAILDGILAAKEVVPQVVLYLVDERLSGERNADTLLDAGLQRAIDAQRMNSTQLRIPVFGEPLSSVAFDRVYVGIGEDGHFASLFPGSYTQEDQAEVLCIEESPK
ncbi:MAG TPA: 6-phosphogluconolactonase, partial [Sphaerochaeta sp.]|nr:6-phosphogluconolactonase [Sphaerochaeta sp.]